MPSRSTFTLPEWMNETISSPVLNVYPANASQVVYADILLKHRIMEQYLGSRSQGPCALIKAIAERTIKSLRTHGVKSIPNLQSGIALVQDMSEFVHYKADQNVRMACESTVVNVFWRYVPVDHYINTPKDLMAEWSNYEKERSHWWRARKAVESDDHIKMKWDALVADVPALLDFHNSLMSTAKLLDKPTLKHTLHLAAMTAEGRIYENGQGRSIASECRHIMVRKQCDIPIKQRPERRPDASKDSSSSSAAGSSAKASTKKRPASYGSYGRPAGINQGRVIDSGFAEEDYYQDGGQNKRQSRNSNSYSSRNSRAVADSHSQSPELQQSAFGSGNRVEYIRYAPPATEDCANAALALFSLGIDAKQGGAGLGPPLLERSETDMSTVSVNSDLRPPALHRRTSADVWQQELAALTEKSSRSSSIVTIPGGAGDLGGSISNTSLSAPKPPNMMRQGSADWPAHLKMEGAAPEMSLEDPFGRLPRSSSQNQAEAGGTNVNTVSVKTEENANTPVTST